jgi:hypothetical protein
VEREFVLNVVYGNIYVMGIMSRAWNVYMMDWCE